MEAQPRSVRRLKLSNYRLQTTPNSAIITVVRHRQMIFRRPRRTVRRGSSTVERSPPVFYPSEPAAPAQWRRQKKPTMAVDKAAKTRTKEQVPGEPKGWRPTANPIPRFLAKIERLDSGCWQWTAATYPGFRRPYTGRRGDRPSLPQPGVCEPRTPGTGDNRENILRGAGPDKNRARAAAKAYCGHGHPFSSENTYNHPAGYRACRACMREAQSRYSGRKKTKETMS
jgi:hypothetical protein